MTALDITMVGEANIDLLLYGLPKELPLERELLANRMELQLGGSPAITAHNLAMLGSRVGFVTPTASDIFSEFCLDQLAKAGVDLARTVSSPPGINTGVTVLLQHEDARHAFTYPGVTNTLCFDDLDLEYLKSARHFHLSSFFLQESLQPDIPRLFSLLKKAGMTISLDTNDDPSDQWAGNIHEALAYVDILLPNEREACALAEEGSLEDAIAKLLERVPVLVVKLGSRGALFATKNKQIHAPAVSIVPVDAVGAGDSFNSGFLHGYVRGLPMERCLRLGNLAGALSTTEAGGTAAFRDAQKMQSFFAQFGETEGEVSAAGVHHAC